MTYCAHHPKYDPASGEPTELWLPCPYCWQVYARHLCNYINEEDLEAFRNVDRIAKLEGQLAEANRRHVVLDQALLQAGIWQGESQKREAALRVALEFYADKNRYPLGQGNIITVVEDSGATARAALEVK